MTDALDRLIERLDRIAERLVPAGPDLPDPPDRAVRAFVWDGGFRPVRRPAAIDPDLLVGIDRQKTAFAANVDRFVRARPAHDVLLWGERGTGKSSLVRTLLGPGRPPELAVLEIPETRLSDLPAILHRLGGDPRRWVLYLDDLSFRTAGGPYRELKVLLEGGLEARPANTLVVATSNRRHLVPESFPDGEEIHPEETVAETVSLADRFGLSLGFYALAPDDYLDAVERHLAALGRTPPDGWRETAVRWAVARGIRSGRAALQVARELAGAG